MSTVSTVSAVAGKLRRAGGATLQKLTRQSVGAERAASLDSPVEAVRWGYRLFLDREPESEQMLAATAQHQRTWRALHDYFINSDEYRARHPSMARSALGGGEPAMDFEVVDDPDDLARLFAHVAASWTKMGAEEPHYSVITDAKFRPDRIEENLDQFYASGEGDASRLLATFTRNGLAVDPNAVCVELGCGVGRVSGWLAEAFGKVIAVDISQNHLDLAKARLADRDDIEFVRLTGIDAFRDLPSYDVFFSQIVLQHNPPPVIEALLDRAFSGLNPGGYAYFQVPTYRVDYRFRLAEYLDDEYRKNEMEMHVLPQPRVFDLAARHGLQLVEIIEDGATGHRPGELSNTFLFRRREG